MRLSRFPRFRLGHFPTPLEPMPNLEKVLGGPRLFIKRDDCTGLALGGSKARKLEFNIGQALKDGADTILIHGSVQSNHARMTAAAAAKANLACQVFLEERLPGMPAEYMCSGNVLLDRLLGAQVHNYPSGTDLNAVIDAAAENILTTGGKPYIIRGGAPNSDGTIGYAAGAEELMAQSKEMNLRVDHVIHASESTGTQAGMIAGLHLLGSGARILGISVRSPRDVMESAVHRLAESTADRLGFSGGIPRQDVNVNSDYVGAGYAQPTPEMEEAVNLVARCEGIMLDPVYTGKAMAALIDLIRGNYFSANETVVFIHTGGLPLLFAHRQDFAAGRPMDHNP